MPGSTAEDHPHDPLNEAALAALVDEFYARVRADAQLGPVFNEAVHDWPEHLQQLTRFWHSIMRGSGTYKGQPVPAHMRHIGRITPELFAHWLMLWRQTTDELMPAEFAAALQAKAARIADSLQLALFFRIGPPGKNLGQNGGASPSPAPG